MDEGKYVTAYQLKSIEALWEFVGSMPRRYVEANLHHLRMVAPIIGVTAEEFFDFTDGFFLDEEEVYPEDHE